MHGFPGTPYDVIESMLIQLAFGSEDTEPISVPQVAAALGEKRLREQFMENYTKFLAEQEALLRAAVLEVPYEPYPSEQIGWLFKPTRVNNRTTWRYPTLDAPPRSEDFDWERYIDIVKQKERVFARIFAADERLALVEKVREAGLTLPGLVDILAMRDHLRSREVKKNMMIPLLGTVIESPEGRVFHPFALYEMYTPHGTYDPARVVMYSIPEVKGNEIGSWR